MKKIFITGSGGFLGGYLTKRLVKEGYEVHGLYTGKEVAKQKKTPRKVIMHQSDLMEYKEMGQIVKSINPDFIIHLAARTEVEKSFYDPIEFSEINYCGTVNLIEAAKECDNLKLFLFASTMETYGWTPVSRTIEEGRENYSREPFTENTLQSPNAPYAVAKVACEKYLEYAARAYGFPYCTLRQTNAYGRWDNDFFVVEQIITQMLKNPKEVNLGYGKPHRNFLFVDDLINLYVRILEMNEEAKFNTFCTGPANALSIEKLAGMIADKLKWRGKINWDTKPKRVGEIYYLNSSNEKAYKLLRWKPQVDLSSGLNRTIKLWKDNLKKTNELHTNYF